MKIKKTTIRYLLLLLAFATLPFLTACGGGNGDASAQGKSSVTLTAADPYIVGAIFQEVGSDGNILQLRSTPSDTNGQFHFSKPLTLGSTVEMILGSQGEHAGAPYEGILKVKVPEKISGSLTVSPLTTLLANGASQDQILELLKSAGLNGVTAADLTADPMAGLGSQTSVTDDQLRTLLANMAANAFMSSENNYNAGADALTDADKAALFRDLIAGIRTVFNQQSFSTLAASISTQTGTRVTVGDVANTMAHLAQTVTDQVRQELKSHPDQLTTDYVDNLLQTAWAQAPSLVTTFLQERLGHSGAQSGTDSGTDDGTGSATTPPATLDGATLYADNCATCHGDLAETTKPGRTAAEIQTAINTVSAMQSLSSLTPEEIQAIAAVLPTPQTGDSGSPIDGTTLYVTDCSSCHGPLATSTKAGATADQIQNAINNNIGGMGALSSLSADQIQAIASVLPPAPTTGSGSTGTTQPAAPDGATLYADNCAACHGALASSAKAGATADQIQNAISTVGAMSSLSSLTSADIQAIADALATSSSSGSGTATGGDTTPACGSCHGLPPDGSTDPNVAGAHAAHQTLADVGTNCDVCHSDHIHQNGVVEIGISSTFDAKSGIASENPDGTATCVNVSCHGGETTPDWYTGSIDVSTQCKSCHAYGTAQYNSYSSGQHGEHSGKACTVCHSASKLKQNHFGHLATSPMEGPAAVTIGGAGTLVSSYDPTTQTCTNSCHGSRNWTGGDD